ncbi:MAG: TonB-dependent receptor plug domain-containing protein [Halothiobacillaceae bacterium]
MFLLLALVCCSPAAAWAGASETQALAPVVVTGTGSPRLLEENPVRTEVLDRETLDRLQADSLQEALRFVPGLLLREIHGKGGQEVWMQGLNGDRVLVLIDGVPVTASTGSTVDLSQVGLLDVDRIEIVKGAMSALYGSSAMGGVINVITRDPRAPRSARLQADLGSYGDADRGSFGRARLAGRVGARGERASVELAVNWRDTDGFDLTPNHWATQGDAGSRLNLDLDSRWMPNEQWRFEFKPGYYRESLENRFSNSRPGVGAVPFIKGELATRLRIGGGAHWQDRTGRRLSLSALHDRFEDQTWQDAVRTLRRDQQRDADLTLSRVDATWNQPLFEQHFLTLGVLAQQDTLRQTQTKQMDGRMVVIHEVGGKVRREAVETFLQGSVFLADGDVELLPGLRFENDSDFGSHWTPKLNAMWWAGSWKGYELRLRGGLGQGYRVPNLKERHYIFDHSALGYIIRGNPDLQPEESTSFQLGFELLDHESGASLDVNLYHNRIRDLISTVDAGTEEGVLVFEYANVGRAVTQGVEIGFRLPRMGRFSAGGGYTLLDTEDRETGLELVRRPRHQFIGDLTLHLPEWRTDLMLLGEWSSDEYVDAANRNRSPAWGRLDLRANIGLDHGLTAYLGIDNLTDLHRDVSDPSDLRPVTPRLFYAGIRWDY